MDIKQILQCNKYKLIHPFIYFKNITFKLLNSNSYFFYKKYFDCSKIFEEGRECKKLNKNSDYMISLLEI